MTLSLVWFFWWGGLFMVKWKVLSESCGWRNKVEISGFLFQFFKPVRLIMVGNDILMWHRINQEMTLIPLPWAEQGTRWDWIPKGSVFQLKTRSAGTNFWEQDVDFGAGHPMDWNFTGINVPFQNQECWDQFLGAECWFWSRCLGINDFIGRGQLLTLLHSSRDLWGVSSCGEGFHPVDRNFFPCFFSGINALIACYDFTQFEFQLVVILP